MKRYIGIRAVDAEPALLAEALNKGIRTQNKYLPITTRGYIMKYADGRVGWLPKEEFDKMYFLEMDINKTLDKVWLGELIKKVGDFSNAIGATKDVSL